MNTSSPNMPEDDGWESVPQNEESFTSIWPVPSGTKDRSPRREPWVGVRAENPAPDGRHSATPMCRPSGAMNNRIARPPVKNGGLRCGVPPGLWGT